MEILPVIFRRHFQIWSSTSIGSYRTRNTENISPKPTTQPNLRVTEVARVGGWPALSTESFKFKGPLTTYVTGNHKSRSLLATPLLVRDELDSSVSVSSTRIPHFGNKGSVCPDSLVLDSGQGLLAGTGRASC